MNSSCNFSSISVVAVQRMVLLVSLLIGTTIVGNLLFVVLFLMYRQIRTPFNYILLNIAVGDAIMGIFNMPQYTASYFYYGFFNCPFSEVQWSFWIFVDYLMPSVTLTSLAALSADCFWAVLYPATYRAHNTTRKTLVIVLFTWFLAFTGVIPGFTYIRLYLSNQSQNKTCLWGVDGVPMWTSFYALVLNVWMQFLVSLVCYVGTVFKLIRIRVTRTAVSPLRNIDRRMARRDRQERQAFLVVTLLTLALFISYYGLLT